MMGTKVHNNYESLITFTRASGGHALRPVSYGDELVDNGTFDSDVSGWVNGAASFTTLSYDAGTLEIVALGGNARANQGPISVETGKLYLFSAEVTQKASDGDSFIHLGTTLGGADIKNNITQGDPVGVSTYAFVATSNDLYIQLGALAGDTVNYDNISVKEVTFDESDGTLILFEHPDDVPRVEYDADGNRLGLLVEESRTNLVTYSTMKDANYTKTRAEITDNQITSPDGTQNASKVNETTGTSGQHFIYRQDVSYTSGNDYTFSVFVKADTTTVVQLLGTSSVFGSAVYTNFDIENGTIGSQGASVVDSSIQDVGNGWYRLSVTGTATTTAASTTSLIIAFTNNNTAAARAPSYVGDTTQQFYVFGGQVEQASFSTSYIRTTGSTATRSADVASIPVADFGYNQSAGSFVVEFNHNDPDALTDTNYLLSAGANARFLYNNSGNTGWYSYDGITSLNYGSLSSDGTFVKVASSMYQDGSNASIDGGTIKTSTASPQDNVARSDDLYIGVRYGGGGDEINGHIKSIKYYPRRLTNAQLQDLTS